MTGHSIQVQMLFQTRRGQHGLNRLMHNTGSEVGNTVKPVRAAELQSINLRERLKLSGILRQAPQHLQVCRNIHYAVKKTK